MSELGEVRVSEGRADIGSRALVSQGLRWSEVEGSKTMATCLAPNNWAEVQRCESEWEDPMERRMDGEW